MRVFLLARLFQALSAGLVLALTAVLAGCTAGPSTRPPVAANDNPGPGATTPTGTPPLPSLTEPKNAAIRWNDCDGATRTRLGQPTVPDTVKFSCAQVTSTLDSPDLPNRGTIKIAVLKAGSGTIPLVFVGDIEGEPGTLQAARLASTLPPDLLQRFSLVGVDRRGSGSSDPVSCIPDDVRQNLVGHDPAAASIEPVLQAAQEAGQQCAIELAEERQALDSGRTAGDLEKLRVQLGMDKLNAIGSGEGSTVLTSYGSRYPDKVGRFVLDGLKDSSPDTATVLTDLATAGQSTVDSFSTDCKNRGCPLGQDPQRTITDVVTKLRNSPEHRPDGLTFGPALALRALQTGVAQRSRWPELADALAATQGGNTDPLASFLIPLLGTPPGTTPVRGPGLDVVLATVCNDTTQRLSAEQITKLSSDLQTKNPLFGGLVAQKLSWCSPWPVRREPLPTLAPGSVPPMLVFSTAHDPVTPETGTTRAAGLIPGAVQLKWAGAGHGALSSPCIGTAASSFLVKGVIPSEGTLCPA